MSMVLRGTLLSVFSINSVLRLSPKSLVIIPTTRWSHLASIPSALCLCCSGSPAILGQARAIFLGLLCLTRL